MGEGSECEQIPWRGEYGTTVPWKVIILQSLEIFPHLETKLGWSGILEVEIYIGSFLPRNLDNMLTSNSTII